jgi:microcin C transport system permease protein
LKPTEIKQEKDINSIKKEEKKISVSIFRKRLRKFKTIKRGYYSFLALIILYAISFILPLFVNHTALIVKYNGSYYFPVFKSGIYEAKVFGQDRDGETNYRMLKQQFKGEDNDNWVLMPIYPYSPNENRRMHLQ